MDKAMSFFLIKCMFTNPKSKKYEIKDEIRAIADNYGEFEDMVFEIGCRQLADEYLKHWRKKKMKKTTKRIITDILGAASFVMMLIGILFMSRIPEMSIFLLAGAVLGMFECHMERKLDQDDD